MRVDLEGGALCFKNTSKSTENTPQNKQETSEYLNNHFGTGKIAITRNTALQKNAFYRQICIVLALALGRYLDNVCYIDVTTNINSFTCKVILDRHIANLT